MKKYLFAMVVAAIAAGGTATAAEADTTTVNGGTVNFVGQVVDAACSVTADSVDQTVNLSQVRSTKLTTAGMVANQKEDFNIKLEDCDTTVSQNAAVIFNGQEDANQPGSLAMNVGETSSNVTLINGGNTIPLSVDYIATGAATSGNVEATATFSMVYS